VLGGLPAPGRRRADRVLRPRPPEHGDRSDGRPARVERVSTPLRELKGISERAPRVSVWGSPRGEAPRIRFARQTGYHAAHREASMRLFRLAIAAVVSVTTTVGLLAQNDALTAKARGIHERVMTLDTHNDISPAYFTSVCNYTMDVPTQVNLPKMIKGGLDASFFVVYV